MRQKLGQSAATRKGLDGGQEALATILFDFDLFRIVLLVIDTLHTPKHKTESRARNRSQEPHDYFVCSPGVDRS